MAQADCELLRVYACVPNMNYDNEVFTSTPSANGAIRTSGWTTNGEMITGANKYRNRINTINAKCERESYLTTKDTAADANS